VADRLRRGPVPPFRGADGAGLPAGRAGLPADRLDARHAVGLDGRQRRLVSARRPGPLRRPRWPPGGARGEPVMLLRLLPQLFRRDAQKVAAFCAGRPPEADEAFAADCGVAGDAEEERIAVAVRRAVAVIGSVDPHFIRAADVYPKDLAVLPFWDSIDWLAFV